MAAMARTGSGIRRWCSGQPRRWLSIRGSVVQPPAPNSTQLHFLRMFADGCKTTFTSLRAIPIRSHKTPYSNITDNIFINYIIIYIWIYISAFSNIDRYTAVHPHFCSKTLIQWQVTIFGESVGGFSVCSHLASPASRFAKWKNFYSLQPWTLKI